MSSQKTKFALNIVSSFFIAWGLSKAFGIGSANIFTFVIFILSLVGIRYVNDKMTLLRQNDVLYYKRSIIWSFITGLIFTIFYIINDFDKYIADLSNNLFRGIVILAVFIGFVAFFVYLLIYLFYLMHDRQAVYGFLTAQRESRNSIARFYVNHTGLSTFIICIVLFIPYFLYQYPGIMTPDSIVQYEQALNVTPYSNHHPWIHTLILKLTYNLGFAVTKDINASVAFYTVLQMCFMAFCASYVVTTLRKCKLRAGICFVITLFYALVPFNAVYAITIWKDVPFAGIVAIFVCTLIRFDTDEEKKKWVYIIQLILSGTALCLFRSNGLYAYIVLCPLLLIKYRKQLKVMLTTILISLAIVIAFKGPVMHLYNVSSPDFVESVAIPIQQMAKVLVSDRAVSDSDLDMIDKVIDRTYIKDIYYPYVADNMKELVRAGHPEYLAANKGQFLGLYIKWMFKYPGDYIKAYADQTRGFIYPDMEYTPADTEGIVANTLGMQTSPIIAGRAVVKAKEIMLKLGNMLPVYALFWSMGTMFWILLFFMSLNMVRGEMSKNIYLLIYLLIMGTLLIATPLSMEARYGYFLIFGWPLFTLPVLCGWKNNADNG